MFFATRFGQIHLTLTFTKPGTIGLRIFVHTMMTASTTLIFGAQLVGGADRAAAGVATVLFTRNQPVANRHAAIENIAFTVPHRLFGGHIFEVFQNTALEVKDFVNTLTQQIVR